MTIAHSLHTTPPDAFHVRVQDASTTRHHPAGLEHPMNALNPASTTARASTATVAEPAVDPLAKVKAAYEDLQWRGLAHEFVDMPLAAHRRNRRAKNRAARTARKANR